MKYSYDLFIWLISCFFKSFVGFVLCRPMFIISNIQLWNIYCSSKLVTTVCIFGHNNNQLDEKIYTYLTDTFNSDFTLKSLLTVNWE